MFKVGDVVTATAGVMRGRRLTVSYVGQRIRCKNAFEEEYIYANDELRFYAEEAVSAPKPVDIVLDYSNAVAFNKSIDNMIAKLKQSLEICDKDKQPDKQLDVLFKALDISVADLSIRHAVASIPNIIEE